MTGHDDTSRLPSPRRRYHFHYPGLLYIIVTFFVAVGAINSQNNLLFATLGLAIGGLLISGVLSGASLMGVRLERLSSGDAAVGAASALRYRIHNVNRLVPAFGLSIDEVPAGEETDTSWQLHMRPPRGFVSHIPARGSVIAEVAFEPLRRGRATFDIVRIWTTFPFGLAKKSVTFSIPSTITIHPVELPVRSGLLRKLNVRASSGEGSAVTPGIGDDFYGLREYSEGDNPRLIAWRRSAKTGQMVVRQNTMPAPRRVWFILNLSGAASRDHLSEEKAIAVASAVIRAAAKEDAAIGLCVPGTTILITPKISPRAVRGMLDALAALDVAGINPRAEFPFGAIRSSANVVIHLGEVDRAFGTGRSRHIDASDCNDILAPGERLHRAMALLNRAEREVAGHPPWSARVRAAIIGTTVRKEVAR